MRNISKKLSRSARVAEWDFTLCEGEIHALMGGEWSRKINAYQGTDRRLRKGCGRYFSQGNRQGGSYPFPAGRAAAWHQYRISGDYPLSQSPVAENMYIGRGKGVGQNWKKMNAGADRILRSLDIPQRQRSSFPPAPLQFSRWLPLRGLWIWTVRF